MQQSLCCVLLQAHVQHNSDKCLVSVTGVSKVCVCASAGTPLGLLQDCSSGSIQLWSAETLHDVTLSNEGKDMWRIYLEHQVWEQLGTACFECQGLLLLWQYAVYAAVARPGFVCECSLCCTCTMLQDYTNALKLAAASVQRDTVYQTMGADAAAAGDFKAAGAHYGRIVGGKPPFEELALMLVESGDPEALQVFLSTKLQVEI